MSTPAATPHHPADSLSSRLHLSSLSSSHLEHNRAPPPPHQRPAESESSPTSSDYSDEDTEDGYYSDDSLGSPFDFDFDSTQAIVMLVPILVPMLAKMAGRYVTVSLMRKYFASWT
ncbi:uncharacterized protein EV422DRAFT_505178 [Fimicolochytrium jonesii]|uniref:uncharacterized protein n=1 Tax=Fimicolochytrium jonesii TaxID=1396493 RepID=UPI0022FF39F5|nr:uncharacterized protein EV422DRAFT_505178 [Fimicolochytrium jonesii]KAI8823158.1 hypothetical protein EV422DRAFT_505178 [Fimicolochytrium jonesii]